MKQANQNKNKEEKIIIDEEYSWDIPSILEAAKKIQGFKEERIKREENKECLA